MLFTPVMPMLLQMGKEIINDDKWIYDIKWDGWRVLLHKNGDQVKAYTRHGNEITSKFPELQEIGPSIKANTAILDCEGVVLRNGISVFEDFNFRGKISNKEKIQQSTTSHPATFIAFDVLLSDMHSHLNQPLFERKQILSSLIEHTNQILISPSVQGNGKYIFELTKAKNMEGIVGKRIDSTYHINHRSSEWLKFKHWKTASHLPILGFKENPFS